MRSWIGVVLFCWAGVAFGQVDGPTTRAREMGPRPFGHQSLEEWKGSLTDRDARVRLDAVRALFGCSGIEAGQWRDPLVEALKDPDERIRLAATMVLAHNNRHSPGFDAVAEVREQVPLVVQMLSAGGVERKRLAMGAAAAIGSDAADAVPLLINELTGAEWQTRRAAKEAIRQMGKAAVEPLLGKLGAGDDAQRAEALQAFTMLEELGRPALPELEEMLGSRDQWLVLMASDAIVRIDERALRAMPQAEAHLRYYIESLKDTETEGYALWALGGLGEKAGAAIPALVEYALGLEGKGEEAIGPGLLLAGVVGATGWTGVEELLKLVREGDEQSAACAAMLLGNGRQWNAQYLPRMWEAAKDRPVAVRAAMLQSIGSVGRIDEPTLNKLAELLDDREAGIRAGAAIGLFMAEIPLPQVFPRLQNMAVGDADEEVRKQAAATLEHLQVKARVWRE